MWGCSEIRQAEQQLSANVTAAPRERVTTPMIIFPALRSRAAPSTPKILSSPLRLLQTRSHSYIARTNRPRISVATTQTRFSHRSNLILTDSAARIMAKPKALLLGELVQ